MTLAIGAPPRDTGFCKRVDCYRNGDLLGGRLQVDVALILKSHYHSRAFQSGRRMKHPRITSITSKVSIEEKRQTIAAAVLEGVSVSTFTRNAVVRACQERIAESVKDRLCAEDVS